LVLAAAAAAAVRFEDLDDFVGGMVIGVAWIGSDWARKGVSKGRAKIEN
jgi:hypothetical protein